MHTAISWFTRNPVAANLLTFILLIGGIISLLTVHQEKFPSAEVPVVTVTVPYLGAAPEEAEQGVCIRIEEALEGTEGIEKLFATASEGSCTVQALLYEDANQITALNEIKSKVDGINTFPAETEKPIVSQLTITSDVLTVAIFGNTDERSLKEIGQRVRDDIAAIDGISRVNLNFVRPYEVSIEVSEFDLRRYGLTLDQVAQVIRNSSLDLPGGTIKSASGEILLRAKGQAYWGQDFENIVVVTRPDGTKLYLSDIAKIRDTFEEGDLRARFNGQPAVMIKVWQVGKEDTIEMAEDIQSYMAQHSALPAGIEYRIWGDEAAELVERIDLLMRMALSGLVLVMVSLTLFLKFRLAMWVCAGIPIALFGTFAAFPYTDISLSTMTIMAFILVLGILVDDAIVVGERVYGHEQMGKPPVQAAIDGTWEVSIPVIFGVLTTVAAFLPLVLVDGRMSAFFGVIGWVVIIALFFSIIESQLILPAHLAHRNHSEPSTHLSKKWNAFQSKISGALERFAEQRYKPLLERAVSFRYTTAAAGLGVLIIVCCLVISGRVIFAFFPSIEGNQVIATIEMPRGIAVDVTSQAARIVEEAAFELTRELEQETGIPDIVVNQFTTVGQQADRESQAIRAQSGQSHIAEVVLELKPIAERGDLSAKEVANRFREMVGPIPDAVKLSFTADSFSAGEPINFELRGRNVDDLRAAAAELRSQLSRYDGVFDISDSFRAGKQEIQLSLLPEARNLGITLADLANQVRSAFYGAEVQRVQRDQDDVRIFVRYPESERSSIGNLEDMYIRTPQGTQVPFYSVAEFTLGRGYSSISRMNGKRVINVIADVDRSVVSPEEVNTSVLERVIPEIQQRYPRLDVGLSGEAEERVKALGGLFQGSLLALILIYALLAVPLRSYLQPLVIMSVIPFGAIGAIFGHYLMGYALVFFSALGIVALSGVVVNSSLVLVDYINRRRREGVPIKEAVLAAGVVRFRPIMLTSVTTFVGLLPMMSITSPATIFFVPMAISLAFGVLFATAITLLLVPALYCVVEDVSGWDPVAQGMVEHESELATLHASSEEVEASGSRTSASP